MDSTTAHAAKLAAKLAAKRDERKRRQIDLTRKERRDPAFKNRKVVAIVLDRLRKAGVLSDVDSIDAFCLIYFDSSEFVIDHNINLYELGMNYADFTFREMGLTVTLPINQMYYNRFDVILDDITVVKV